MSVTTTTIRRDYGYSHDRQNGVVFSLILPPPVLFYFFFFVIIFTPSEQSVIYTLTHIMCAIIASVDAERQRRRNNVYKYITERCFFCFFFHCKFQYAPIPEKKVNIFFSTSLHINYCWNVGFSEREWNTESEETPITSFLQYLPSKIGILRTRCAAVSHLGM